MRNQFSIRLGYKIVKTNSYLINCKRLKIPFGQNYLDFDIKKHVLMCGLWQFNVLSPNFPCVCNFDPLIFMSFKNICTRN